MVLFLLALDPAGTHYRPKSLILEEKGTFSVPGDSFDVPLISRERLPLFKTRIWVCGFALSTERLHSERLKQLLLLIKELSLIQKYYPRSSAATNLSGAEL